MTPQAHSGKTVPAFDPANSGHWKLQILLTGVEVSAALAREFESATGVPVTRRLLIELPRKVRVLANVHVSSSENSGKEIRPSLDAGENGWFLRFRGGEIPLTVRPPIEISLRGRVLHINDYIICDLSHETWGTGFRAHFGFPPEHIEAAPLTMDPVLDAIEEVARSRTLRGIHLICYGDPQFSDEKSAIHVRGELFEAIQRNFATVLSLETWPPETVAALEAAYATGIDQLYLNLGAAKHSDAKALVPERTNLSAERYNCAFDSALEIFEGGSIKSALFLDSSADTAGFERAVSRLLKDKIVPLPWVRPDASPKAWEHTAGLLSAAATAMEKSKVNLARVDEWALQLPPAELRYFHPEQKQILGGLQSAATTGIGRAAQRNLSAIRRHLRVRGESDSSGAHD